MKNKLILLSLFPSILWAAAVQEIVDRETGKEIASTIKDIEVKEMLSKTQQFNDCRKLNTFSADGKDKDKKIQDAQKCFAGKIGTDEKKLKELSDSLNLQNYGLVKSNTVKEIQNYLNDKMYEVMTGVNRKESDRKKLFNSMKFKNKKQIDQGVFITLYKAQLSKNALYEVSRYCFEDLRYDEDQNPTTFGDYWLKKDIDSIQNIKDFNDKGKPVFGNIRDIKDKDKIYQDLFQSMNIGGDKGFPVAKLSDFFMKCGKIMVALCEEFKKDDKVSKKDESDVDAKDISGAASCLAKSRLQDIKKALAASELLEKEFEKMSPTELENALLATEYQNKKYKLFEPSQGDTSIDSLTNHSSSDILEGNLQGNSQSEQREKDCLADPTDADKCAGFISTGDSFEKAKHNIDMEMSLKRQVEIERVKALKKAGDAKLEEYLKENGYFALLEKTKNGGKITDTELEEFIANEFEAKKVATLSEINKKIGKRQVSKEDLKNNPSDVADKAKEAVNETKEERARLAQVVLFNNIITSHLELKRMDANGKRSDAGRNVNAWNKEEQGLKNAKVETSLFANLKSNDGKPTTGGMNENEQIGGADLIDEILGKKEDKKNP